MPGRAGLGAGVRRWHWRAMRAAMATMIGLVGFLLYVGGVLALADHVLGWHWALQAPFFVLAGIAWVWPARWLMIWGAGSRAD